MLWWLRNLLITAAFLFWLLFPAWIRFYLPGKYGYMLAACWWVLPIIALLLWAPRRGA
jgi:hypothetical protein